MVWAINKIRPYVEGTKFTVMTDHFSLQWLNKLKEPSGRLARWSVQLQQYQFDISCRKGIDNVTPDALSRAVSRIDALEDYNIEHPFPEITDVWYIRMRDKVANKPLNFSLWRVENNILYKRVKRTYPQLGDPTDDWSKVVPKNHRKSVIKENHDHTTQVSLKLSTD